MGGFSGTGASTAVNNSGSGTSTLTVGTGAGTGAYAGVIADHSTGAGVVALTKTGTGTITLSGANTYTGPTSISAGVLALDTNASLGGTAVTVNGGTLQINGNNTIGTSGAGSLTLGAGNGGTLSLLNSGLNTLTIANSTVGATAFTLGGSTISWISAAQQPTTPTGSASDRGCLPASAALTSSTSTSSVRASMARNSNSSPGAARGGAGNFLPGDNHRFHGRLHAFAVGYQHRPIFERSRQQQRILQREHERELGDDWQFHHRPGPAPPRERRL